MTQILQQIARGLAEGLGQALNTLATALLIGAGLTWGALTVLEIYWRVVL